MANNETNNMVSQMRKGVFEYLTLLMLSGGRAYSSDIIARFKESNLIVVEGTVYTLLNRLRREGKLDYEWVESPQGPPRKYYFLTPLGMSVRDEMSSAWDDICRTVSIIRNNHINSLPQK